MNRHHFLATSTQFDAGGSVPGSGSALAQTTARSGLALPLFMAVIALGTVNAAAQVPAIIPVEQEPRHRTLHEDAQVRVLEIRIPPGDESLMHNHMHDGVHVTVQGARISETEPGGWWASTHAASETGLTYYSALNGKQYAHQIKNIDNVATHIIALELLGTPPAAPRATAILTYSERIANNERVEVGRIKSAAGARIELPPLPQRTLLVSLSSGAASLGDTALELRPGSLHWLAPGPGRTLTAPAGQAMELIAIQFR